MHTKLVALSIVLVTLVSSAQQLMAADAAQVVSSTDLRETLNIKNESLQIASVLVRIDRSIHAVGPVELRRSREEALQAAASVILGPEKFAYHPEFKIDDIDRLKLANETRPYVTASFYEYPQGVHNPPTIYGRLIVAAGPSEDSELANKMLGSMSEEWLKRLQKYDHQLTDRLRQDLVATTKSVEKAQNHLDELLAKQIALASKSELPYTVLMESIGSLQREKQSTQLELVGLEARAAAIQEQVKLASERSKTTDADTSVIRELQEVLNVKEQQLARIHALHESGTTTEHEVLGAREQLLKAKVDLAKARAAAMGGGERLDKFNTDLVQVAIDTTAAKAKLAFIEKEMDERLHQSREQRQIEQELESVSAQVDQARTSLANTKASSESLNRRVSNYEPTKLEVIEPEDLPRP